MIEITWTTGALVDLEDILTYVAARSPQGAATIAARIRDTERTIMTFPRATRRDPETGAYEAVVSGTPLLVIYELVTQAEETIRADVIAVFHTSRDPASKPGRRD